MLDNSSPLHKIADLGEFGLIKHLTQNIRLKNSSTLKGIGDDAAVLTYPKDAKTLVTTDLLIEGIHFNLAYMPLKHLGYKAVVVNLSDLCAMNAIPQHLTVSLAFSNRFTLEAIEELYAGMQLAADYYQVDLVGGDISSSITGLTISVTAIGYAFEQEIIYRNKAQKNDLIVVTGDLGAAYLGLQILEREHEVFKVNPQSQPDLEPYSYLISRQLKPEARTDIRKQIHDLALHPTSMIDISDGLSSELFHICTQSDKGCIIYENKLPIDPAVLTICEELNLNSTTIALNGGEDYELLFTLPLEEVSLIKNHPDFTIIGHITPKEQGLNIQLAEQIVPLKARGWNAFH